MCGICGLAGQIGNGQENIHRMNVHMRDRGPDAEGIWSSLSGYVNCGVGEDACDVACSGRSVAEPDGNAVRSDDGANDMDRNGVCGSDAADDVAVALGHRRLAILDLTEQGAQPFTSASGRLTIAYNGEIYNHQTLRAKLLSDGHVKAFRSTCDTETLVEAIEAYGMYETLRQCKGMFAIAVYDRQERTLTLARDRVGEKPLYFGFLDGIPASPERGSSYGQSCLAFASDIGAIAAVDGFRNEIRRDVLPLYFRHGYIPAPYSIYEHIWKLYPGTILTIRAPYAAFEFPEILPEELCHAGGKVSGDGWELGLYYSMQETALYGQSHLFEGSYEEAVRELEERLCSAISDMMIADVPLGAFLSAGIDSPTIAALMQRVNPGKVNTYTIGMEGQYDEAPMAAEIARTLGVHNTQMYITDQDARDVIPLLPRMFGEPFADSSQIPTYLVSKMTRQYVTVSLSGDAGDELFCGYRSYASLERIWGKMQGVPLPLRRAASGLLLHTPLTRSETRHNQAVLLGAEGPLDLALRQSIVEADAGEIVCVGESSMQAGSYAGSSGTSFAQNAASHRPQSMEELLREDILPDALHTAMLRDLTMYHPDDILVKVDRTAMAVSLETRVPFLDRDVMEFAWSLPLDYVRQIAPDGKGSTSGAFTGKRILRDILYQYVPRELMERPKKGFSIPIKRWLLAGDLRAWAEELLDEDRIRKEGYLNAAQVTRLWRDFTENGRWRNQIWYILMFEAWLAERA